MQRNRWTKVIFLLGLNTILTDFIESKTIFGFKKGHSIDLCIYALKEYIEYYKNRNTSVFVTMLDASKAFDRVNFWLLFQKLVSRNVPLFIVRILAMWYTHQKMCIRWGNAISPSFTVSNDIRYTI